MSDNQEVKSPCIGVCAMDDSTGFCLGCYRSLDEIKNWWEMSVADQKALLAELASRQVSQADFD
jgi:predicted Fe-S protein YdhL (DUF1289 family)